MINSSIFVIPVGGSVAQFELFDQLNLYPPLRSENIMSLLLCIKSFFSLEFHASSHQSGSLQALIFDFLKSELFSC